MMRMEEYFIIREKVENCYSLSLYVEVKYLITYSNDEKKALHRLLVEPYEIVKKQRPDIVRFREKSKETTLH